MPFKISRQAYAETYGPTKGDRIRLADTDLILANKSSGLKGLRM